jgi:tryptophan-rich sensory protein
MMPFIVSILITLMAAVTGGRFRPDAWYAGLAKPPGLPPPWVFPVVWTALYVMMAIAAALIFITVDSPARTASLVLYVAQLGANAAWSWLFFGRRAVLGALLDLLLLIVLVALTTWVFFPLNFWAGLLLVPYLVWLFIALYLNAAVWYLNRAASV